MFFADVATDTWVALSHQGPFVVLTFALLFAGYKRIWVYSSQPDRESKLKDELITSLREQCIETLKLKDVQIERVEEELRREREEKELYRQYTFRLLEAARDQIPIVTEAALKIRGAP